MRAFQNDARYWAEQCFPLEMVVDLEQRCDRFTEEAIELVQSLGYPAERAHDLVDYVYGRPVGDPHQETGGVMVTLAVLLSVANVDLHGAAWDELARIIKPEVMAKIRQKQLDKPIGSARPGPST